MVETRSRSGERLRASQISSSPSSNGHSSSSPTTPNHNNSKTSPPTAVTARTSPYAPTPSELLLFTIYPALLAFGALFALLSPDTRSAPYDPHTQAHAQDPALSPSYFAQKNNVFNVLFVKRGWAWVTGAFLVFVLTHPALAQGVGAGIQQRDARLRKRGQAVLRWAAVTLWWVLVTQWCFGAPLIDRGFRWTGGKCHAAEVRVAGGLEEDAVEVLADKFTAAACKASGGKWRGGHDISGHVFLLVLGSGFLLQEVVWATVRWAERWHEERSVVMADGAVKRATVERERDADATRPPSGAGWHHVFQLGGKTALAVVALSWWMMLMTAIYFHTWVEKLAGLFVASVGLYAVYILPRFVPPLRAVLGLPGV